MPGETLSNPELPSQRFSHYIDSHTDIILEPETNDPNVTRMATWVLSDSSILIPVDTIDFKVMIDLGEDKTIYHEILYKLSDQQVLWLGYDSGNDEFSCFIGDSRTQTEINPDDVVRMIDELIVQEQKGNLRKQ